MKPITLILSIAILCAGLMGIKLLDQLIKQEQVKYFSSSKCIQAYIRKGIERKNIARTDNGSCEIINHN